MASFRCYDNSDVIATLITTNFHLYLIQLWWQFFQMFVYGVVVYAQKKLHRYWPWKTVSSHFHMLVRPMLWHRMALVSVRLFCKNLGNLQESFGQMVYRPPLAKNCPYAYENKASALLPRSSRSWSCKSIARVIGCFWFFVNPLDRLMPIIWDLSGQLLSSGLGRPSSLCGIPMIFKFNLAWLLAFWECTKILSLCLIISKIKQ